MENPVQIEGMDEVLKRLNKVINGISAEQIEGVLMKGARVIKKEAERRVGAMFKVKTGRLSRSMRAKRGKNRGQTFASVFAAIDRSKIKGSPHAHLLEKGTSKMPAKPFWRPSIDTTRNEVADVVNKGIRDLLGGALR